MLRASGAILSVLSVMTIGTVGAQEVRITNGGGGMACLSRSAIDELSRAAAAADLQWAASIRGCGFLPDGARAVVADFDLLGVSRLLVFPSGGGDPLAVWTHNENFEGL